MFAKTYAELAIVSPKQINDQVEKVSNLLANWMRGKCWEKATEEQKKVSEEITSEMNKLEDLFKSHLEKLD